MKKLLCLLLALCMVFSLVACGAEKAEEPAAAEKAGDSAKPAETAADPASEEPIQVTIAHMPFTGGGWEGYTLDDNPVKDWVEEKLGIEIEYSIEAETAEDYTRLLSLAVASGDIPDIIVTSDKNLVGQLVENDLVWDITDVFEEYASDTLKGHYTAFSDTYLDVWGCYDGRMMCVPRATGDGSHIIYLRLDWLEKLNLDLDPDGDRLITRDEVEMVAKAFMEADLDNTGNPVGLVFSGLGTSGDGDPTPYTYAFGGDFQKWLKDENGNVYCGSTCDGTKESVAWLADMYQKGLLDPQFGVTTWDDYCAMITTGRTGICTGEESLGVWQFLDLFESNPEAMFTPYWLDDGTGHTYNTYGANTVNKFAVVSKSFDHPEILIQLLNCEYELDDAASCTEEGSPIRDVDRVTRRQYSPTYLDNGTPDDTYNTYSGHAYKCIAGEMSYDELDETAKQVYDSIVKYKADPASTTAAERGFYCFAETFRIEREVFNNGNKFTWIDVLHPGITETMSAKQADLDKLELEAWVKIITGEETMDYWDTFVADYNSHGADEIKAEVEAVS